MSIVTFAKSWSKNQAIYCFSFFIFIPTAEKFLDLQFPIVLQNMVDGTWKYKLGGATMEKSDQRVVP
jgi:hypothetical protein